MKRLFLIAGANGSGKSTISKVLLSQESFSYVNPDDIARAMCPQSPEKVRIAAGRAALTRISECISRGESFAIETTLSGRTYANLLNNARTKGYVVTIAYVYVDSPFVCIKRIASRVKMGGHYISDDDVRRRYVRSKSMFFNVYRHLCDHWLLLYNGGTDLVLVAHGNGEQRILDAKRFMQFEEGVCQNLSRE